MSFEEAREYASDYAHQYTEQPIPATWPEYLATYGFDSSEAIALSRVLASPQQAHPTWFKKAEIAIQGLDLAELNYDQIAKRIRERFAR